MVRTIVCISGVCTGNAQSNHTRCSVFSSVVLLLPSNHLTEATYLFICRLREFFQTLIAGFLEEQETGRNGNIQGKRGDRLEFTSLLFSQSGRTRKCTYKPQYNYSVSFTERHQTGLVHNIATRKSVSKQLIIFLANHTILHASLMSLPHAI